MVKIEDCGPFLFSIIKNSDLKTIDWEAVGREYGITKHSAYCRYYELKKAMTPETKEEEGSESTAAEVQPTVPKRGRGRPPKRKRGIAAAKAKVKAEPISYPTPSEQDEQEREGEVDVKDSIKVEPALEEGESPTKKARRGRPKKIKSASPELELEPEDSEPPYE